jgi:hypothetical protein
VDDVDVAATIAAYREHVEQRGHRRV